MCSIQYRGPLDAILRYLCDVRCYSGLPTNAYAFV